MRRPSIARSLALAAEAAVLVVALRAPVSAQRITGMVRDSVTGERITGAVVSVLDSAGALITRNLSDTAGHFSLGRYRESFRLTVIRLGYSPREIRLGADDSVVTVLMRVIPTALATVTATSRRVCPGDDAGGQALVLWEQVRSALTAALVSRQLNAPRIGLMSFRRTRDPIEKRIDDETRDSKFVVADRAYVAARPAWVFAYDGYMREEVDGSRTYYAPDEGVLLDVTFASTHCMHAVEGSGAHKDDVGLAFEPITTDGRDTLVDVKGVLWVDRGLRSLRSLEFEYTGLERPARGSGGELIFRVMPNGASMVQQWLIHSAILATDVERTASGLARRMPPRPDRYNVRLIGYQETGGEIALAEWSNGLKWRAPFPQLRGVVLDSLKRPVSGVVVRMTNHAYDDSLTTDNDGRFNFPPVRLGLYRLFVTDSLLAAYGFSSVLPRQIVLGPDDQDVTLQLRPPVELLRQACSRDKSYVPGTAVVFGRVLSSDGTPATDVRVDASWRSPTADATRRANTDDEGRFVICGATINGAIDLATGTRRQSAEMHVDALKSDVTGVTLVLKPRPH